jgi:CheY-like chemotaxis protein
MVIEKKKRVLIVDNDEHVSAMLRDLVETFHCDVVTTWSGIEALTLLKSRKFDLVLVDDYLSDLHIGYFLDRISGMLHHPQVVAIQTTPKQLNVGGHKVLDACIAVNEAQPEVLTEAVRRCLRAHNLISVKARHSESTGANERASSPIKRNFAHTEGRTYESQ